MITVEFECDHPHCHYRDTPSPPAEPIPVGESVDIYPGDWDNGTPIDMYLPEGWVYKPLGSNYARVWCPKHSSSSS